MALYKIIALFAHPHTHLEILQEIVVIYNDKVPKSFQQTAVPVHPLVTYITFPSLRLYILVGQKLEINVSEFFFRREAYKRKSLVCFINIFLLLKLVYINLDYQKITKIAMKF